MINKIENLSNNIFHPINLINPVKSIITPITQFCPSLEIQYLTQIGRMNATLMAIFGCAFLGKKPPLRECVQAI